MSWIKKCVAKLVRKFPDTTTVASEPVNVELMTAVHRWFEDGSGWAIHPGLSDVWKLVVDELTQRLHSDSRHETLIVDFQDGFLLARKRPDPDCRDDQAVARNAWVLTCVHIPYPVFESIKRQRPQVWTTLLQALDGFPVPETRGVDLLPIVIEGLSTDELPSSVANPAAKERHPVSDSDSQPSDAVVETSTDQPPSFWHRYHNHFYCWSSVIGLVVAFVFFFMQSVPVENTNITVDQDEVDLIGNRAHAERLELLFTQLDSVDGVIGLQKMLFGEGLKETRPVSEWIKGARQEAQRDLDLTIADGWDDLLLRLMQNKFGSDWYLQIRGEEPIKLTDWVSDNVKFETTEKQPAGLPAAR